MKSYTNEERSKRKRVTAEEKKHKKTYIKKRKVNSVKETKKLKNVKDVHEYVHSKLGGGWATYKELNDATVCVFLCLQKMNICKDVRMRLVKRLRAQSILIIKLNRLLAREWTFKVLTRNDIRLLDQMCRAMYEVDMDDGELLLGKLLQYVFAEDEKIDKAAMMSNPMPWNVSGCFRTSRWYARNYQYPSDRMSPRIWEWWASFDPPVSAPIPSDLQWSVLWGSSLAMLKRLIVLPGWDLDRSLIKCCEHGMLKHVTLLLEHGANINARDNDDSTALAIAGVCEQKEVVELLINRGADVNAKNNFGNTVLAYASLSGRTETVELLKQHGAK